MNKTSKHVLQIWNGGSEDPYASILMDSDAKRHMKITLRNVKFSYTGPNKVEKKTVDSVPVELCSDNYFENEYEKNFLTLNRGSNLLCAESDTVYLQGTRDSRLAKKDHAFIIYEFAKCSDPDHKMSDPLYKCAQPDEITAWLETKSVHMLVLNNKIDFSRFDDGSIRQNEIWLKSMLFKEGMFTD